MVSGDYMEKYAERCCCVDEGSGDSLERAALIMMLPDVSCPYYASHCFFFFPPYTGPCRDCSGSHTSRLPGKLCVSA